MATASVGIVRLAGQDTNSGTGPRITHVGGSARDERDGAAVPNEGGESLRVFLSYRRSDNRHLAGRLRDLLSAEFGDANVFFDVDSIAGGDDFRVAIRNYVDQVDVMLVLIGPAWEPTRLAQGNDFVRMELSAALSEGKPIIPVLIDDTPMPAPDELPEELNELAYLNSRVVRPDPDFRGDAERLARAVRIAHLRARGLDERQVIHEGPDIAQPTPPPGVAASAPVAGEAMPAYRSFCTSCGAPMAPGAAACSVCGHLVGPHTTAPPTAGPGATAISGGGSSHVALFAGIAVAVVVIVAVAVGLLVAGRRDNSASGTTTSTLSSGTSTTDTSPPPSNPTLIDYVPKAWRDSCQNVTQAVNGLVAALHCTDSSTGTDVGYFKMSNATLMEQFFTALAKEGGTPTVGNCSVWGEYGNFSGNGKVLGAYACPHSSTQTIVFYSQDNLVLGTALNSTWSPADAQDWFKNTGQTLIVPQS
jgi:hypothetical protein